MNTDDCKAMCDNCHNGHNVILFILNVLFLLPCFSLSNGILTLRPATDSTFFFFFFFLIFLSQSTRNHSYPLSDHIVLTITYLAYSASPVSSPISASSLQIEINLIRTDYKTPTLIMPFSTFLNVSNKEIMTILNILKLPVYHPYLHNSTYLLIQQP